MKNIRVVVFDFFGVYVNNFPQQTGDALFAKFSIKKEDWDIFVREAAEGLDTGEKEEMQFVEAIVKFFKLPCSPEELGETLKAFDDQFLQQNHSLDGIIRDLKNRYTVACFSNVSRALCERMDEKGLYSVFDRTFFSYQIGKTKKDPQAWEYVERELGCKPGEALFIDDSEENVRVALGRGWHAMRYGNDGSVEAVLKGLLA